MRRSCRSPAPWSTRPGRRRTRTVLQADSGRAHQERRVVLRRQEPRRGDRDPGRGVQHQARGRGEVLRLLPQGRVLRAAPASISRKKMTALIDAPAPARRRAGQGQHRALRDAGRDANLGLTGSSGDDHRQDRARRRGGIAAAACAAAAPRRRPSTPSPPARWARARRRSGRSTSASRTASSTPSASRSIRCSRRRSHGDRAAGRGRLHQPRPVGSGIVDPIRAIEKGAPIAICARRDAGAALCAAGQARDQEHQGAQGQDHLASAAPKDITRIYVERMLAPNGVKPGEFDYRVRRRDLGARCRRCRRARSMPRS